METKMITGTFKTDNVTEVKMIIDAYSKLLETIDAGKLELNMTTAQPKCPKRFKIRKGKKEIP